MKSDLSKLGLKIYAVIITVLVCYFTFRAFHQLLDDPGVGWHLQSGAWILEHRELPYSDPFLSVTRPWISDQWLSDVFFAELFSLGGWSLVSVSALFLFFIPALWILPQILSTIARPFSSIAFASSLAVVLTLMGVHLIVRPVLFSFIFFSLQVLIVVRVIQRKCFPRVEEEYKSGSILLRSSIAPYAMTIFIYTLWANMHPSFFLGLVVLLLGAVAIVIERFFLKSILPDSSATSTFISCTLVGIISSFATPYGTDLHKAIFALGQSDFFMRLNSEWLPLSIREDRGLLLCVTWVVIFFSTYLRSALKADTPTPIQRDVTETFMTCGSILFSAAALFSARFLPYAAMFIFFPLLWNVSWFFNYYLKARLLRLPDTFSGVFIVVIISLGVLGGFYQIFYNLPLSDGPSADTYPYTLLDQAKTIIPDKPTVIYNHPDVGGFITFFGDRDSLIPVLDDRNSLLGEDLYREFLGAKTETLLAKAAKSHGAELVIQNIARIPLELTGTELTELGRGQGYVLFSVK